MCTFGNAPYFGAPGRGTVTSAVAIGLVVVTYAIAVLSYLTLSW